MRRRIPARQQRSRITSRRTATRTLFPVSFTQSRFTQFLHQMITEAWISQWLAMSPNHCSLPMSVRGSSGLVWLRIAPCEWMMCSGCNSGTGFIALPLHLRQHYCFDDDTFDFSRPQQSKAKLHHFEKWRGLHQRQFHQGKPRASSWPAVSANTKIIKNLSLCPGSVQLHWVHSHSGPVAPHLAGLLQDALGVQHRGRSHMPGSSRTLHNHVLFCKVFFSFLFLASGCHNGLSRIWDGKGNDVSRYSLRENFPSAEPPQIWGFSFFRVGFKICVKMFLH